MKALGKISHEAEGAAAAALYAEGFALDADMVPRIPVDFGLLRGSHYVAPPTYSGGAIVVEVGVGTEYAVFVHERTELRHPTGEAKFLERAIAARAPGMATRLAKAIGRNLANGTAVMPLSSAPAAPSSGGGKAPARRAPGRSRKKRR